MKCYLISNAPAKNMAGFAKKVSADSLVCCFNDNVHGSSFSKHKHKYIFLNSNDKKFWGFDQSLRYTFERVYFAQPFNIALKSIYDTCGFNNKYKIDKCLELTEGYPKFPSIGFQAVGFLLTTFPDVEIVLVNFTGEGWSGHDWVREQTIYKELGIEKISVN